MFHKALCYASLNEPENKLAAYRQNAIDSFTSLATKFPKSPFAPGALMQAAMTWTILKNPEKTEELIKKLQRDYPQSPEALNADYNLATSLLALDKREQAVPVFKRMIEGIGSKYTENRS